MIYPSIDKILNIVEKVSILLICTSFNLFNKVSKTSFLVFFAFSFNDSLDEYPKLYLYITPIIGDNAIINSSRILVFFSFNKTSIILLFWKF